VIISEDRQNYLARLVIDGLWGDELIDFDEDEEDVIVRGARLLIQAWTQEQGDIDENIRTKITNQKKGVPEGSPEWNVLYKKYFQEEMSRRGSR
jgi:uncharacterized protein